MTATLSMAMEALLDWKLRCARAGPKSREAKLSRQRLDGIITEPNEAALLAKFESCIVKIVKEATE